MDNIKISIFQALACDETPEMRLRRLDHAAAGAAGIGSHILICPELYLSGYLAGKTLAERAQPVDGDYAQKIGEIAKTRNIAVVYTYPEAEQGVLYNAVGFIGPDGYLRAHHRKNHLPGDYEPKWMVPGSGISVFTHAGWKIAMLICYDIEFPEAARQAALLGAELLIVPTALAAKWIFVAEKLVPVRAFENGVYLAYANFAGTEDTITYLGGSRIVAPDGVDVAVAGSGEEILSAELERTRIVAARDRLPYLRDRLRFPL